MDITVVNFLKRFHSDKDIDVVFTNGCCYWFAEILCRRFPERSRLMYDQVANHFVVEMDSCLYDITGNVTDEYDVKPWDELDDDLLKQRIIRDCIMF